MPSKQSARRAVTKKQNIAKLSSLKKGDMVMVISGGNSEKSPIIGKVGKILGFTGKDHSRVIVEGVNLVKRHMRQTAMGRPSGIVTKEAGIHISNVMYYAEKISRPVRLRHSFLEDGTKVRGYIDPETKSFVQI